MSQYNFPNMATPNFAFANRLQNGAVIYTTTVPKARILGFFLGRKESEAVIDPRGIQRKRLVRDAPPSTEEAA
jgi:hypothetical protein